METCRLCLYAGPEVLDIHKTGCEYKYTYCTHLQIDPSDRLPQGICLICYNTLDHFFYFKQMANHSNATLLCKNEYKQPATSEIKLPKGKKAAFQFSSFVCDVCNKSFSKKPYLISHLSMHKQFADIKCQVCNKMFKRKTTLRNHLKIHEPSKTQLRKFECLECDRTFTQKSNLKRHLTSHKQIAEFECDVCKKTYKYKSYLKMHKLTHLPADQARVYKCDVCPRSTKRRVSFIKHLKTHQPADPSKLLKCDHCPRLFRGEHRLKLHRSKISQVFKCDSCFKTFPKKYTLDRHLISHKTLLDVKCEICDKMFKSQRYLKSHKVKHFDPKHTNTAANIQILIQRLNQIDQIQSEKSFECNSCNEIYATKLQLIRHLPSHKQSAYGLNHF